jgi:hypothetical protein
MDATPRQAQDEKENGQLGKASANDIRHFHGQDGLESVSYLTDGAHPH